MVLREFSIEGMGCQGCADAIASALNEIPGIRSAMVSLETKRAVVSADESQVSAEMIVAAIAAAGYEAQEA